MKIPTMGSLSLWSQSCTGSIPYDAIKFLVASKFGSHTREEMQMPLRNSGRMLCLLLSLLSGCLAEQSGLRPALPNHKPGSAPIRPAVYAMPLFFEAGDGRGGSGVKFFSRGERYSVFLTSKAMVLSLHSPVAADAQGKSSPLLGESGSSHSRVREMVGAARANRTAATISIELIGCSEHSEVGGEDLLPTKVNYFIGRDPKRWRTNLSAFSKVRYKNIYPGIDLVFYGNNHQLEYDFEIGANADPSRIQFLIKGSEETHIDTEGNLVVVKGSENMILRTPNVYQLKNGVRARVQGSYSLRDSHVSFALGAHDSSVPLVIDPVLLYSTLLGGTADDFSSGIGVDSAGNTFVSGITNSADFPLANIGTYDPSQFRMYLVKMDPTGTNVLFADYFGSTAGLDDAYAIGLDSLGNPYVTGETMAADFPVVNAYQSTLSGTEDAFLVKFSSDGSSIVYSTYLGGSARQFANSVSVDPSGQAVIAGVTQSFDFPAFNAFQASVSADQFGNTGQYGFITKFSPLGTSLVFSSYLSGSILNTSSCNGCFPDSEITGVTTDLSGNAYVTGFTNTTDFPVSAGAFETSSTAPPLMQTGFISKFASSGALAYSTYINGLFVGILRAIDVDSSGSAYATGGVVLANSFPVTNTSICDPATSSCIGAIILKLDPAGSQLVYSTYLGTSNWMEAAAIKVNASGTAFIVGSDVQFDLVDPLEQYAGGEGDTVLAEIDSAGTAIISATFLGGSGLEAVSGLALGGDGSVYVSGITQSADFPVTQGAFQGVLAGQTDTFVAKIDPVTDAPAVALAPFSLLFPSENVGGTSAPQTSILRNMGSSPLSITRKVISGDFSESDDCGDTLAAASFCTFTILFTPTTSGTLTGSLTLSDNALGSPHILSLGGTGAGPVSRPVLSPTSLAFGASPIGTPTMAQRITLSNEGTTELFITDIQARGDFTLQGGGCATVPPNGDCTLEVGFSPTASGLRNGTLTITDSLSGTAQVVSLTGTGLDFATSTGTSTATLDPGETAKYEITVRPIGGNFLDQVSFACSGAPALSSCVVSPSALTPGTATPVVEVVVSTSGAAGASASSGIKHGLLGTLSFAPLALFSIFLVVGKKHDASARWVFALLLAVVPIFLTGCANVGKTSTQSSTSTSTAPGTYTLTVTATSGHLSHSSSFILIVR